jgi:transglutaminase/protease-like cytokinesis protein 3
VVHPAIVNMPASAEESIESVAAWVRAHESDPFERIKALHDWEVTRLHYDTASLDPKARKSQDASTVFQNRMGVCEGYARLLVALAKLTGDEVVYVVGEARDDDGNAMANGHAWNAAHIRGAWYFIDVTWDDPVDQNGQRKDTYSTDYLFTPPSIALLDHLPDDARWQLTSSPITRVAFVRQPMTRPGFAKYGLHLVTPNGPLVDAHDTVDVVIDNPRAQHVMVSLAAHDDSSTSAGINCTSSSDATVHAHCVLPAQGRYDVEVFAHPTAEGWHEGVAHVGVQSL